MPTENISSDTSEKPAVERKRACITGGAGALAQATRAALEERGFEVLAPTRTELDVTDAVAVSRYFSALEKLDLLVLNAGINHNALLTLHDDAEREAILSVNLRGVFLCARAAVQVFQRSGGGQMLFIGSSAGTHGTAGQTAYAASKSALCGFSAALAQELGPENIRCNVVLPGWLPSRMTAAVPADAVERVRKQHALGRFTTLQESAAFIAHIACTEHISGQFFQLDSRPTHWW